MFPLWRKTLIPLLVASLAIGSVWYVSRQPKVGSTGAGAEQRAMDSFMENFTTRLLDAQGTTRYEIHARAMAHYPYDDHAEFQAPLLTLYRPAGDRWTVASDTAWVERGAERITLQGAVHLRQFPQDARQPGVAVDTRDLLVLPDQSYAETAQQAVITQGAHTLKSVGLKADFRNDQFELLSQVRGSYVPAP